jgi:ATP-dependent exoDNAse (exonuclease V) alpha subunit
VNGNLGRVEKITDQYLKIHLVDGTPVAAAKNFPVSLTWAMTIHKAQGTPQSDGS